VPYCASLSPLCDVFPLFAVHSRLWGTIRILITIVLVHYSVRVLFELEALGIGGLGVFGGWWKRVVNERFLVAVGGEPW